MLYKAKVARVIGPNVVEVEIALGFNLTHRASVWLKDVSDVKDTELKSKANHCLVVLLGGKNVFLGVESPNEQRTVAYIFRALDDKNEHAFDGFICDISGIPGGSYPSKALDVNKYINYLAENGYDVQDAKERIIRGRVLERKVS